MASSGPPPGPWASQVAWLAVGWAMIPAVLAGRHAQRDARRGSLEPRRVTGPSVNPRCSRAARRRRARRAPRRPSPSPRRPPAYTRRWCRCSPRAARRAQACRRTHRRRCPRCNRRSRSDSAARSCRRGVPVQDASHSQPVMARHSAASINAPQSPSPGGEVVGPRPRGAEASALVSPAPGRGYCVQPTKAMSSTQMSYSAMRRFTCHCTP